MINKLIKEGKETIKKTKHCVLVGMYNQEKIVIKSFRVMEILDDLFEKGLIKNSYFDYLRRNAIISLANPTMYQRSMWSETRGKKPINLEENTIFAFECWIEDKYKGEEIAAIIKKFSKLDCFYLSYVNFGEKDDDSVDNNKKIKRKEKIKVC